MNALNKKYTKYFFWFSLIFRKLLSKEIQFEVESGLWSSFASSEEKIEERNKFDNDNVSTIFYVSVFQPLHQLEGVLYPFLFQVVFGRRSFISLSCFWTLVIEKQGVTQESMGRRTSGYPPTIKIGQIFLYNVL